MIGDLDIIHIMSSCRPADAFQKEHVALKRPDLRSVPVVPILTSSWRTSIPDTNFVRVSISRSAPRGVAGFRRYPALAPGQWFRSIADPRDWAERYQAEILAPLDPATVVATLRRLSVDGRPIVLLCWESAETGPDDWCHRGLVSVWLLERLGLEVFELGYEACGCGRSHPKLPACLRGP
jgi:hypothetical protein